MVQKAFSSDAGTMLHLAIPMLKTLYKAWSSHVRSPKYAHFELALDVAAHKIDEYYEN
jgi:hypothetical protein